MPNHFIPTGSWMRNLRVDDIVHLAKENKSAFVAARYQPPALGHVAGQIALDVDGHIQNWLIKEDGTGFDGKPLLYPCVGHLSTKEQPVPGEVDQIKFEMGRLREDVNKLSDTIKGLNKSHYWITGDARQDMINRILSELAEE